MATVVRVFALAGAWTFAFTFALFDRFTSGKKTMENASKDKLITDIKAVLFDVEDLLKAASAATGETAAALREKASGQIRVASEKLADVQEVALLKGKEAARQADDYVHANPWKSVGVAAAAGFLIGLLVNRK